jgi:hypothetical protein
MQKLNSDHEVVIERVLMTEENVIGSHRTLCDKAEELTIKQRDMLDEVEQPGSDVKNYLVATQKMLSAQIEKMIKLKEEMDKFALDLETEENMSKLCNMQDLS